MPSDPFRFTIPGQVVSWNRAYRVVKVPHKGGGGHLQLAKTQAGWDYQTEATSIVRQHRPKHWEAGDGQIRIRYWFRFKRAIDGSNGLKLLEDAIALGLGVDDSRFLPCVEEISSGHKDPSVTVEVQHHEDTNDR